MAMTLNLTLVVQIAHFLIAYALLSRFFLRPGYRAVKSDENRLRQLRAAIITEQKRLAEKQEYKRNAWVHCQHYFYQHRPVFEVEKRGVQSTQALEPLPEITQQELETLAAALSGAVKKQVLRD